jgi:hypothetical protein
MNKVKLKKMIKEFTINCALATAMFVIALSYAMIVWSCEGMLWLLILDIVCFVGDIFCAIDSWKKIEKTLEE